MNSHSVRPVCQLAVFIAVAGLAGCDNAVERLSVGEWREVGEAQPPLPPEGHDQQELFVVTTTASGDGPVVHAGDLVKAHVTVTTVNAGGGNDIWVWTARQPSGPYETYGAPGGDRPRAAFIGRHLHEQFEMHLHDGADVRTGDLPIRGIIAYPLSVLQSGAWIDGNLVPPPQWPALALRGNGGGSPSARVEILEICPGAKYYQRSATLSQFGYDFFDRRSSISTNGPNLRVIWIIVVPGAHPEGKTMSAPYRPRQPRRRRKPAAK